MARIRQPLTCASCLYSTERTFREIHDPGDQVRKCRELCEKLAGELQEKGLKGRTITLKIKYVAAHIWRVPAGAQPTRFLTLLCARQAHGFSSVSEVAVAEAVSAPSTRAPAAPQRHR